MHKYLQLLVDEADGETVLAVQIDTGTRDDVIVTLEQAIASPNPYPAAVWTKNHIIILRQDSSYSPWALKFPRNPTVEEQR